MERRGEQDRTTAFERLSKVEEWRAQDNVDALWCLLCQHKRIGTQIFQIGKDLGNEDQQPVLHALARHLGATGAIVGR